MVDHFYYHPGTENYEFGPKHPLRPERLRRTKRLVAQLGIPMLQPPPIDSATIERLHETRYVEAVRSPEHFSSEELFSFGMGYGDCPIFPGMYESTLAYCACAVAAGRAVAQGAHRAYNIAGGLHHAMPNRASGFCIFNDPGLAINELLARFERVAYVDLDVHHGDGVQFIFQSEPRVLCCSIHQDPRTLYPGTGMPDETGPLFNGVNVILPPETGCDAWIEAFREGILPALERFKPDALVIQHGTDSHFLDPLARVRNTAARWFDAVRDLHHLDLPTVVLGGGGYRLECVPRMWVRAILIHAGIAIPSELPEELGREWGTPTYLDTEYPYDPDAGRQEVRAVVNYLKSEVHPRI